MRKLALTVAALAVVAALVATLRPVKADVTHTLYVSGMKVAGKKRIAIMRLTNTSPDAADVFYVHYTIRDALSGNAVSMPGAGLGAQLSPGKTIELDLGAIITQWRLANEVTSLYSGDVQVVAFGEGGFYRSFGPDVVHVEIEQHEGRAIHDAAVQWVSQ
jgi:hypothetical protein